MGELARERQTLQVQKGGQDLPQGEQEVSTSKELTSKVSTLFMLHIDSL